MSKIVAKQKLCNGAGEAYDERPVLAGPHEWEIAGLVFRTVLVKCNDDKAPRLSVVDVRSGKRFGRVEVKAPKTRPHEAIQAVSRLIDELRAKHGDNRVRATIDSAPSL